MDKTITLTREQYITLMECLQEACYTYGKSDQRITLREAQDLIRDIRQQANRQWEKVNGNA